MKAPLLLLLAATQVTASAADGRLRVPPQPAAPASSTASPDSGAEVSGEKAADALWDRLQTLKEPPNVRPKTREESISLLTKWITDQKTAAEAFMARFPKDPRRYGAQLTLLQCGLQLAGLPGSKTEGLPSPDEVKKQLAGIVAAPDAPEEFRGEAAFVQVIALSRDVDKQKPASVAAFFKASDDFLKTYPTHRLTTQMRVAQLQLAGTSDAPESTAVLERLATSTDERLAEAAKQTLARKQKLAELKTKPMDLKFTATDGQEFTLKALRGKVVLIDFWASWCGPCIAEMPNVVATYEKLRAKGFEIVGISLDNEKADMEGALKKHHMTWRQYFDGKGWKNEISSAFGITSIPAAWLIDKKGMLRETGLRGENLGRSVEKLLAE